MLQHTTRFMGLCAIIACAWCETGAADGAGIPGGFDIVVPTASGDLGGFIDGDTFSFRGVPYAEPPLGALRWAPPEPRTWTGVWHAGAYGSACTQTEDAPPGDPGPPPVVGAEDCLYLNVWTPATFASGGPLPVVFFIHGGANLRGSGHDPLSSVLDVASDFPVYDGARWSARGNVVVVTINYRLGTLGYFEHPDLALGATGNYGLLDQIAALEWIRGNAPAFGGDPDRITIVGQSAGGQNVCALLVSPFAAGAFARAAMHSGGCDLILRPLIRANSATLAEQVGCDGAPDLQACLFSLPPEVLVSADIAQRDGVSGFPFFAYVDGHVVVEPPMATIERGAHNAVPLLVGTTSNEYAAGASGSDMTVEEYVRTLLIEGFTIDEVLRIVPLYPPAAYPDPAEAYADGLGDRTYVCVARRVARAAAPAQLDKVYRFHFVRILSAPERRADGAYHSTDLLYLFQHMDGTHFLADDEDRAVEKTMLDFWTRFAATGNPNGPGQPFWPSYRPLADTHMVIDATSGAAVNLRPAKCNLWDALSQAPGGRAWTVGSAP